MDQIDDQVLILTKAIAYFGKEKQIAKAIEEMAELIKVLVDPRSTQEQVVDEIADNMIMITQLAMILGDGAAFDRMEYKLNRLAKKIDAETAGELR